MKKDINKAKLVKILKNKSKRKQLFAKSFELFVFFYFSDAFNYKSKDFHREYIKYLEKPWKNVMFTGFRNCGKTVLVKFFIIWCICYKRYKYIEFYCYDSNKSKDRLYDIAIQLQTNKKILNDFGSLFYEDGGDLKKSKKKGIGEFVTSNEIKVQAKSIGVSPRGDIFGSHRPDLAVFDDVDVLKSVNSTKKIDKTHRRFKDEVVGGLANQSKIVFLGNVIKEDGVLPRLENDYKENDSWHIMRVALYKDGKIIRPERYCETKKEAKKINKNRDKNRLIKSVESLREDTGSTSFKQNYLLEPRVEGQTIIKRGDIQYFNTINKKGKIYFGIDPAFSQKTGTDSMALVITKHIKTKQEKYYYVLEALEFKGRQKNEQNFIKTVKNLYDKYKPAKIHIEGNNGGEFIASRLKRKNLAVKVMNPKADKVTRLLEYQLDIETGLVKFDRKCGALIDQLLEFPNVEHDDLVDAFVYSLKSSAGEMSFIK